MQPTLFFPFIHTYGLMLAIGFYTAWYLAARRARPFGVDPDIIGNLVLISILAGVAGARILHFALYKPPKEPLWAIVKVWEGGLVFYGGLIGAAVADALYLRWKGISIWRVADIAAPAIALGQAFGRIGCFFNGCCYGGPARASFPLAVRFPRILEELGTEAGSTVLRDHVDDWRILAEQGKMVVGSPVFLDHLEHFWIPKTATASLPVHPTQLYTAAGLFLIAALLVAATPHRRRLGSLLGLLFVLHGSLRLAIEFVRTDTETVALGLKAGQIGALVVLAIGAGLLLWLRRRGREVAAAAGPG